MQSLPKDLININIEDECNAAVKKAIHANADLFLGLMRNYMLIDSGDLRKSARVEYFDDTSFYIVYGVPYVDYVFHNPNITPVTPNTTQYWDDVFIQSKSYELWKDIFMASVTDALNKGGLVNGRK